MIATARRRTLARLGRPRSSSGGPDADARLARAARSLGRLAPLPFGVRDAVAARAAGWMSAEELAGRKVAFGALGVCLAFALTQMPATLAAGPLFAAAGWRYPDLRVTRRAREREEAARAALPDALDLLTACALAGMSIDRGLRTIAGDVSGPLGEAIRETLRALDAGVPRRAAYTMLAERADAPEVRSLVRALNRAERYGTEVAMTLVGQAREVRSRRRALAEEAARSAPVKMLFPLVTCFLPAFVLLTVAPVILTALRSFRGR